MQTQQSLRDSLNKAYLKRKISRADIDCFKTNLRQLLDGVVEGETEEFHKNLIATFLKDTWYKNQHSINTKDRKDLVIHNGAKSSSDVGVLIEVKRPSNHAEMPTLRNFNVKATQELLLYYLRERASGNTGLRHLVITNLYEWFIFDAGEFEKIITANRNLLREFQEFEERRLVNESTDYFYREIAAPALANIELQHVYFDLRTEFPRRHPREGGDPESKVLFPSAPLRERSLSGAEANLPQGSDARLALLYKVLSPPHLLKQPFVNDSNTLDKEFYDELLHIIGLTEVKVRGQKLIQRLPAGSRHEASLLENTIDTLHQGDKLANLPNRYHYGDNEEMQLFNVALELVITWINRVLFLKLLEAQLVNYHHGDRDYAFLDIADVPTFHVLNGLFFEILALPPSQRGGALAAQFARVPYLNSSLFEINQLERWTFGISGLDGAKVLSLWRATVLKDNNGKRRGGVLPTLQYLFEFLGAYDFGSEGGGEIQEQNKTLIGAAVLGLIFEKINGYKEGSFFTPGFITTFMCRQTLELAVLNKFNEVRESDLREFTHLNDIYNWIHRESTIAEANALINQLKICDPAVGSGHFLVSALNEIIAIKARLGILADGEGRLLHGYSVTVENDELIVVDPNGALFEYHPENHEAQRVQETLFNEKRTIIENCLFGGDINANSVKICRLRLWIELLKNAYYVGARLGRAQNGRTQNGHDENPSQGTPEACPYGQLETLPNIDINIKHGDSLVSRFGLQADVGNAMRGGKWTVESYLNAVKTYQASRTREDKQQLRQLLGSIKNDFREHTSPGGPQQRKLANLRNQLGELTHGRLFEPTPAQQKADAKKAQKLQQEIETLQSEIDEIRKSTFYENATEWRYEFPEVLDAQGNFTGFDVVIGNPPYIRQEELKAYKKYFSQAYESTFAGTADLYVYFVERGISLLKPRGIFCYILPNKWMRAGYGKALRRYLQTLQLRLVADFGDLPVFDEATTYPCILQLSKSSPHHDFAAVAIKTLDFKTSLDDYVEAHKSTFSPDDLQEDGWNLGDQKVLSLLEKLKNAGTPLGEFVDHQIYYGVKTGLNEAFVIDAQTRARLIAEDPGSEKIIKPFLAGRDIKRYEQPKSERFLIFTRRGIEIDKYPAIKRYLEQFKERLEPKPAHYQGSNWPGRKQGKYAWYEIQDAVDYYAEFEKTKIIIPAIVKSASYAWDAEGFYSNDKTSIIPDAEKYLLGILNSKAVDFYLKQIASTKQNGYFEYKPVYVSQLPICHLTAEQKVLLEEQVEKVLSAKAQTPQADTTQWESAIDALVYELYGLTAEEIEVVEGV